MEYCGGDIPEGFVVWDVKPTLWGVFKCIGEDENVLVKCGIEYLMNFYQAQNMLC